MYTVVLWQEGQPLGQWSAQKALEVRGVHQGPMVAVLDESGGIAICQPMDPNTGQDWASEQDALDFGYRYLGVPADENAPVLDENQ